MISELDNFLINHNRYCVQNGDNIYIYNSDQPNYDEPRSESYYIVKDQNKYILVSNNGYKICENSSEIIEQINIQIQNTTYTEIATKYDKIYIKRMMSYLVIFIFVYNVINYFI